MNAPMTKQSVEAWQAMISGGMKPQVAFERAADWAAMLEERLAEFDPNYATHPWGRNKISIFAEKETP